MRDARGPYGPGAPRAGGASAGAESGARAAPRIGRVVVGGAALTGALVTGAGLAALLAAAWRRDDRVGWVAKPLASTGFLAVALASGALGSDYGHAVLVALVLCWIGDVLLIPKHARGAFLAGLVSFLLGHVAFVAAFGMRSFAWEAAAAAAVLVLPAAALAWRWLAPHVSAAMRAPVVAYVAVISAMVVAAVGAAAATGDGRIAAGALAFYASDLAVARERFVARTPWNRTWGLPLYYGATLLLATTVDRAG